MNGVLDAASPEALELPAAWPAGVTAVALARRRRLLDRAQGAVLDLAAPQARRLVRDAAFLATGQPRTGETGELATPPVVPQPASFDTVVSVAALVQFADLPLALRGIGYLLRPRGELLALEPFGRSGAGPLLAASLTAACQRFVPAIHDVHLHRDVAAALRAEGFVVASIERFTMPTNVWPLRSWMQACSYRRASVVGDHPDSAGASRRGGVDAAERGDEGRRP